MLKATKTLKGVSDPDECAQPLLAGRFIPDNQDDSGGMTHVG